MAESKQFLDFEPTEMPTWRETLQQNADGATTISDMVNEIVNYRHQMSKLKRKKRLTKTSTKDIDLDMLIHFLFNIQTDEDIGLQNEYATKEVINMAEEDWSDFDSDAFNDLLERILSKLSIELKTVKHLVAGRFERQWSSSSSQESIGSDDKGHVCRARKNTAGSSNGQSSTLSSSDEAERSPDCEPPNYPSFGNTEETIRRVHEDKSRTNMLRKQVLETINLYRGYKLIAEEISKVGIGNKEECLGLMDVDVLVLGLHKTLMDNVMADQNTKPGRFSTNERKAQFKGQLHIYPRFANEEIAHIAIQTLVDKYADILEDIRTITDKEIKIKQCFKLASLFLFGFLTLHPFGDGNGRLARLLCSYSLLRFSPFLTPIFNVFSPSEESDYIDALVKARQGLVLPEVIETEQQAKNAAITVLKQKPSDLCSLLIESNCYCWKYYIRRISDIRQNHDN